MKKAAAQPALLPLTQTYQISARALALAGGYAGMLDLFDGRLASFVASDGYIVAWREQTIGIVLDQDKIKPPFMMLTLDDFQPRERTFTATLEGVDPRLSRQPWLPTDDPFVMLFRRVRVLIGDWPEIAPPA